MVGLSCGFFLEKHQLFIVLRAITGIWLADQKHNGVVLPFRDNEQPDRALRGQCGRNPFLMGFHGIPSIANPGVDRQLHHVKAVSHQKVTKLRCLTPLLFGFHREVEHH